MFGYTCMDFPFSVIFPSSLLYGCFITGGTWAICILLTKKCVVTAMAYWTFLASQTLSLRAKLTSVFTLNTLIIEVSQANMAQCNVLICRNFLYFVLRSMEMSINLTDMSWQKIRFCSYIASVHHHEEVFKWYATVTRFWKYSHNTKTLHMLEWYWCDSPLPKPSV